MVSTIHRGCTLRCSATFAAHKSHDYRVFLDLADATAVLVSSLIFISRNAFASALRTLAPENSLESLKKIRIGNFRNFSNCLPLLSRKRTIRNDLQ